MHYRLYSPIHILVVLALILYFSVSCSVSPSFPIVSRYKPSMPSLISRKKIMMIGSSITQRAFSIEHHGWGAQLSNWFSRTSDVLNRGAGGYNSRWTLRFLHRSLGHDRPDVVVLFIGNNDSIEDMYPQHVSVEEYQRNIMETLRKLGENNPNMVVLLVSASSINEEMKPKHSNARRQLYSQVLRDIVHDHKAGVIEPALPLQRSRLVLIDLMANNEYHIDRDDLCDGQHFNQRGNQKLFDCIKHTINEHFPYLSPDILLRHTTQQRRSVRKRSWGCYNDGADAAVSGPHAKRERAQSEFDDDDYLDPALFEDMLEQGEHPLHMTVPRWSHLA